jgi:hypothetical protein
MSQSYQSLTTQYFKNNKDYIYGFMIGLLLLLTAYRQSVGLLLLIIFIVAIAGLTKPSKEFIIIAAFLVLKIIIITIICKNNLHDINLQNIKILVARIITDVVLILMIFVRLKDKNKVGFYWFCIALFLVDLIFNAYAQLSGVSLYGAPLEARPMDWIGRSGGVFNHSFYSICISLIALFSGMILRIWPVIMLATLNILMSGSQRGLIYLMLIAFLYLAFHSRVKRIYIYLLSALMIPTVYLGVLYLARYYPKLSAHNERIFRWEYAYEVIAGSVTNFNGYLRFNLETLTPKSSLLINSPFNNGSSLFLFNAESYYLSEMVNYGLLMGLISSLIFFYVYLINKIELSSIDLKLIGSRLAPTIVAFFVFIDGFIGYSMGVVVFSFYYSIVCFPSKDSGKALTS